MPVHLPGGIGFGLHWAWVPFFGFIFGCATIISLLAIWLAQGHPRYRSNESTVVYISDVGAANHALFIVLGTLTAILFFASIYLDYRLRHTYRIPVRVRRYERAASALSVIFAFICALGCILLTIFDAFAHPTLHWTFSGIFFVALLLSGLFNMVEIGGKTSVSSPGSVSVLAKLHCCSAKHCFSHKFYMSASSMLSHGLVCTVTGGSMPAYCWTCSFDVVWLVLTTTRSLLSFLLCCCTIRRAMLHQVSIWLSV